MDLFEETDFAAIYCFLLFLTSAGFSNEKENIPNVDLARQDNHSELGTKVFKNGTVQYEIDDPKQIAIEVRKDNFHAPEGKKVEKIETVYTEPANSNELGSIQSAEGGPDNDLFCGIGCYTSWTAENVVDRGNLWYFESEGITNSYQGRSDPIMEYTTKKKAKWSANVGFTIKTLLLQLAGPIRKALKLKESIQFMYLLVKLPM